MKKSPVPPSSPDSAPAAAPGRWQRAKRRANIAKVLELLQRYDEQPVRLCELCRQAHVSERTLRSIFNEVFGIGPNRYLHVRRLHRVRAALSIANPNTETVNRIALRFGFSDPGRMAADYHRLFGEYPSTTLMRSRF